MKFQNRLASVLSSVMLARNCVGTQAAIAASNPVEKTGMTKLFSCSAEELYEEDQVCTISQDNEFNAYYLYYEYENISNLTFSVETTRNYKEYVKQGNSYIPVYSKQTTTQTTEDRPSRNAGFRYEKLCDQNYDLDSFTIRLEEPTQLSENSRLSFAIYGHSSSDTPDPSLSEVTGTTTGKAVWGTYDHDYYPWVTNEYGDMINLGTNAYWKSTIEITAYPKRIFALGEPLSTKGLKVKMIEHRSKNNFDYDISDCLQIRTDYDPDTPGEYLVYISSDFQNGEAECDDYLFYTVEVSADLTMGPETEGDTTISESRTTSGTTETETTAFETTEELIDTSISEPDTETAEPETTESLLPVSTATDEHGRIVDQYGSVIIINGTSAVVSQNTGDEPALLKGDVDCSGKVQIANAVLLGDGVATHHGLVVVHGCPVVAVVAERHV